MKTILAIAALSLSLNSFASDVVAKCKKLNLEGTYTCAEGGMEDLIVGSRSDAFLVNFSGEDLVVDGAEHTDGDSSYTGTCTDTQLEIIMSGDEHPIRYTLTPEGAGVKMNFEISNMSFGMVCTKL